MDGSVEAILDTLDSFNSKQCRLDLIHYGVGNVTESDVEMAEAFNGVCICVCVCLCAFMHACAHMHVDMDEFTFFSALFFFF